MRIAVIALFALLAISFAQNPVPIPSLNLTKAMGLWYANILYPDENSAGISCYTFQFSMMSNGSIQANATVGYQGQFFSNLAALNPSQNNAVWTAAQNGGAFDWVAADIVGYTWGTMGAV